MNLLFLGAAVTAIVGAVLAAVDLLSDTTTIELAVYFLVLFISLSFFFLGILVGGAAKLELNK